MVQGLQTFNVLGIPIAVIDLNRAARLIAQWKDDPRGRAVGVREVASVMAMRRDPALIEIAQRTAMNVPDGMPLVWIGQWRGLPVSRTCGPDLMEMVLRQSPKTGLKHFFYGGKEGVADTLADRFRAKIPNLQIVGTYCPPFRALTDEEDAALVQMIRSSGADVVWVGISSPKQDVWMDAHINRLPLTMIGVGAAFDYHAGVVKRAPKWMQGSGLEWLHRLITEPRRLWYRYLVLAPKFVFLVAAEALFRRNKA